MPGMTPRAPRGTIWFNCANRTRRILAVHIEENGPAQTVDVQLMSGAPLL
jgi:hypothetical protein